MARYGVNKVILLGNLGADPEYRVTGTGIPVCGIRLATTESYRDSHGQQQDRTQWHSLVLWRNQADIAHKYLKKGSTVYVEGRLVTNSWEAEGQKKYKTEVEVERLVLLDGRPDQIQSTPGRDATGALTPESPGDDLPF